VNAHIKLELIDTDGAVRATPRVTRDQTGRQYRGGSNRFMVIRQAATDTREVLWYRLRYRVAPARFSTIRSDKRRLSRCQRLLPTFSRST